jgi:Domain of unknown function (DUF4153)
LHLGKTISSFFKQLINTTLRFPLTVVCALAACALFIMANHINYSPENALMKNNFIRLAIESMAGISLFYSFHIYSENKDLDWAKRIGFILLGFCLLGLHFYSIPNDVYNFVINYTLRYAIIILCFHLIVSFSLYNQQDEIEAFWQYNEFLFVRFITTLLFSLILFAGIGGGIWAIDVLFGIDIHEKYYFDVLAFMLFVFNTFFFLNTVPKDTHYFEREKNYQNALRVFVQYVLIPIVILYGVILTIYLGKILLTHVLPKGWVGVPILIFSGIGVLTYLLAYPIRYQKKDIIHLFCRYFFYAMLPFLTLYFSSLIKRISHYGFTEERYMALALGIWLVFISIYILASELDNIIFLPVSLCILLALTSFGPWGMYKFSATNQYHRLVNILDQNELIKDGKMTASTHPKMNREDSKQINSIISYLYTHNEIEKIKNLLHDHDAIKLDKFIKEGFDERNVGDLLGVSGTGLNSKNQAVNYFTCNTTNYDLRSAPLETYGHQKILQFNAQDYAAIDQEMGTIDTSTYYSILHNNHLLIIKNKDTFIDQNLKEYTLQLKTMVLQSIGDTSFFDKTINKITLPYRQQYFNRDSLKFKTATAVFYLDEIKCEQTKKETKAISAIGYAIF